MKLVLPVYYRRINISGLENIPRTGPSLLACNHPNSFLDAILMGTYCPRQLHFLTRSDVFNAPWKKWILSKMNMVPIYRMRDGLDNLDKNQETFEKCREVFRAGGVILIFSEGLCIQELKLRPLKKGTARIALDYIQGGNSLTVVPVGLNYPHPMKFRREIFIGLAPAFNALDFRTAYQENSAKGILVFNKRLETLLRSQVIHLEDLKYEKTIQSSLGFALNKQPRTLRDFVIMSDRFNKRLKEDPDFAQDFQIRQDHYSQLLSENKVEDSAISMSGYSPLFFLDAVTVLPGLVLSYLPFLAIRKLVSKKVKLAEFYDSVLVAGGMIFSLLFTLVSAVILAIALGPWSVLVLTFVIYLSAKISPHAYDRLKEHIQIWRYRKLSSEKQQKLKVTRLSVLEFMEINLSPDSVPSSSPPI